MTKERKLKLVQQLIAIPFLGLGGWCLLHPVSVERLSLQAEYQHLSTTSALLIACFGAQALLAGLLVLFSTFTRRTFLVFGVAMLPFLAFNYAFVFVWPIFTSWMALDLVGNLLMLGLCATGWQLAGGDATTAGHE